MTARVTLTTLARMKAAGERIAVLTAYDASLAALADAAGVDVLLVGDSLGMVIQGHDSTLPVRIPEMVYHTACVARARKRALLIADLPFMSYATPEDALRSAARLMGRGGAEVVKLEGGGDIVPVVARLSGQGVPVCAHLGLQPQSVHRVGGYRVRGRDPGEAAVIMQDALALEGAGAVMLVLECVPAALAADIRARLRIPVIGIGSGVDCDGQVLVLHDVLGISAHIPHFARDFLKGRGSVAEALAAYVEAVRQGSFPAAAETPA